MSRVLPAYAHRLNLTPGFGDYSAFDTTQSLIKYEIIIYWSEEDQAFIAEVPELPGCAADGATYQEALSNTEKIISEWIETATQLGRPIPEPKGRLMFA